MADTIDALVGDDKDPDWKNPAFTKVVGVALNCGFRLKDGDLLMVKWKMLGTLYDRLTDKRGESREVYQTAHMVSWLMEQEKRMNPMRYIGYNESSPEANKH